MPRRARILLPGVPVHLIQRGNNRSACFYAEEDYRFYLDQLAELSTKHGCAIHAYCLMTNHVHLLLTPKHADSLSGLMKALGQDRIGDDRIGDRPRFLSRFCASIKGLKIKRNRHGDHLYGVASSQ